MGGTGGANTALRRAVTSFLLRFLSPRRGTERVLKTIEGRFSKRDTTLPFLQYPPKTGEMAPNRVPSGACENRWHNAYCDPFCLSRR